MQDYKPFTATTEATDFLAWLEANKDNKKTLYNLEHGLWLYSAHLKTYLNLRLWVFAVVDNSGAFDDIISSYSPAALYNLLCKHCSYKTDKEGVADDLQHYFNDNQNLLN